MTLSASLVTGLKGPSAWRFNTQLGTAFEFRAFCCTDPNEINPVDGKEPVAILQLKPNPLFVGDSACYDGSLSYDPDGSITNYAWTFESGCPFSASSASGTVSWSASGVYEVELVVTDGTSLQSTPAKVEVVVKDKGTGDYYIASACGIWYTGDEGFSWSDRSSNLSGIHLDTKDVVVDPATAALGDGNRLIWTGTASGIWVSKDGATWYEKTPASVTNFWGDSPSPALSYDHLHFQGSQLWAAANYENSGSSRAWLFYTNEASLLRGDLTASIGWVEVPL